MFYRGFVLPDDPPNVCHEPRGKCHPASKVDMPLILRGVRRSGEIVEAGGERLRVQLAVRRLVSASPPATDRDSLSYRVISSDVMKRGRREDICIGQTRKLLKRKHGSVCKTLHLKSGVLGSHQPYSYVRRRSSSP